MKLMVIDGNSIVNRAFYGIRLLTTKDGTPTNAVYGFLNILQKLLAEEMPDALCVTFDLRAPTFRHEQFDGYKAQRKGMPEELAVQMPILKDVLDAMNIPRYELAGYEADDLIGSISKKCSEKGWECIIVTGDKDSFQLVDKDTCVKHVKTRMGQTETKTYDVDAFVEEYGFEPQKMVDLKALMGDASDSIPGVAGVGEKTALELIKSFGSLDGVYENIEDTQIKDSLRNKLTAGIDSAKMSYKLALICRDVPIEFEPSENKIQAADNDKMYQLFQSLEFNKLIQKFNLTPPTENISVEQHVSKCISENVISAAAVSDMLKEVKAAKWVSLRHDAGFNTVVINCGNKMFVLRRNETDGYMDVLREVFGEAVKKAGHNIKDTMRAAMEEEIFSSGWVFDTALAAYLLEPTDSSYELKRLAEKYCGLEITDGADNSGQFSLLSDTDTMVKLSTEAEAVGLLKEEFEKKIEALGMHQLYYDIDLALCGVLAEMEQTGVLVDRQALYDFGVMLLKRSDEIQKRIYELAGEEFNINSPKQLGTILFEKLMLPAPKKIKTGWSTNVDVLEKLKNKHPIINLIMDYRQLTKLKTTYADGLIKVIAPDGRIHTSFQMTVTATGRLSSTEPNLQNIPIRRELGGEIRKMFVAEEGNVLVDADYSQIELRLLAHISGDETMKNAFLSGEDIHTVTASQVFDTPLDEVTSLQRSRAKAVNFGIVYGISQFSLAQDIGVTVNEAKRYIDNYLAKYHGVRDYMKSVVEKAKKDGYVSTLYGRRRNLPELKSTNFNIRAFGERVALNMPIQGTAADVIKLAMINASKRLKTEKLRAKLILQIHDELIVECPEEEAETVKMLLREEMEGAAHLSIPLTAEASMGRSWYEAK